MTLGQKIREARQSKGMTQKELVETILPATCSPKSKTTAHSLRAHLEYLAGALGFPTGYFLSGAPVSDGTAPDGLDEARAAYREHRWTTVLQPWRRTTRPAPPMRDICSTLWPVQPPPRRR